MYAHSTTYIYTAAIGELNFRMRSNIHRCVCVYECNQLSGPVTSFLTRSLRGVRTLDDD